jgi:hypothetical protein
MSTGVLFDSRIVVKKYYGICFDSPALCSAHRNVRYPPNSFGGIEPNLLNGTVPLSNVK